MSETAGIDLGARRKAVTACFLSMTVAAGIGWWVFPVYMGSIVDSTGWSLTAVSAAVALWALIGAAFSPVCGKLIDRFGARPVMVWGTILQIVSTILIARMSELWHLYTLLILASLGSVANTHVPVAAVIARWYDEKRGTAMGIALVGMGVGGFIMPMLATLFLSQWGWRTGYLIFGAMLVVLLIPLAAWIREPAVPAEKLPSGDLPEMEITDNDLTAAAAARTRTFWTVGTGDGLIGLVYAVFNVHMVNFVTDAGVSQNTATTAYSVYLLLQAVGILIFGALSDRFSIRVLMVIVYGIPAAAVGLLYGLTTLPLLFLFAVIAGICGGGRSALYPLALGQSFGVRHLGTILGWLNIPFMLGIAVGPFLGGVIRDTTGSYQPIFAISIVMAALSGVLVATMRKERA